MLLLNSDSIASLKMKRNGRIIIRRRDRDEILDVGGPVRVKLKKDLILHFSVNDGKCSCSALESSKRVYDAEEIRNVVSTMIERKGTLFTFIH